MRRYRGFQPISKGRISRWMLPVPRLHTRWAARIRGYDQFPLQAVRPGFADCFSECICGLKCERHGIRGEHAVAEQPALQIPAGWLPGQMACSERRELWRG